MPFRFAFLCGLALGVAACAPSAATAPETDQWRTVTITATPVEYEVERVGRLRFRGGVALEANDRTFGGFSGLETLEDDRLIAVTDRGSWYEFILDLSADGALRAVRTARTAPLRDEEGRIFPTKVEGDAEDVAQLQDGRIAVSFEQWQLIRIYDFNRDGPFGAAMRGPDFAGSQELPNNAGPEAIVAMTDGALLIGAEGGMGYDTTLWVAPLDATEPAPATATYPLGHGYALTSADRLPNGDFVTLERFYAPVIGARARIMLLPASALAPGERVAPVELAALAAPMPVDNFEGIAVARASDGATRLYVISDDNFSARQRTLLLAFDIIEAAN
jgi:hypothetical protein